MKRKRTIFIELTSLLDVILIMIFVLLMQARTQTAQAMDQAEQEQKAAREISREMEDLRESMAAAEAELQDREQEIERLEEEAEGLRRQLSSRELVMENSLVLTLSITETDSIRLEISPQEVDLIPYDWSDDNYAYNRLRTLLTAYLEEAGERSVFIIFQYDRSRIYKNEYDMITGVVQELKLSAREREIPLNFIEMDVEE